MDEVKKVKLTRGFTDPEQSKLVLELGIPADSADGFYDNGDLECGYLYVYPIPDEKRYSDYRDQDNTPCWSVNRLFDIIKAYSSHGGNGYIWFDISENSYSKTLVESCIHQIEHDIRIGEIKIENLVFDF